MKHSINPTRSLPDDEVIQWINRHVWTDGAELATEWRQAREEGRDLTSVDSDFARLLAVPAPDDSWHQHLGGERNLRWWAEAVALVDRVQTLPLRKDFCFVEPDDLAAIRKERPPEINRPSWSGNRDLFEEKLHGGLLGRICGCMLGKPVESWTRKSIEVTARLTGNWPLSDYLRMPTEEEQKKIAAENPSHYFRKPSPGVLRGTIDGMVIDDDINYTALGFVLVDQFGPDFTRQDVATAWCGYLPILHTCTAERVAYRNFVNNVLPPLSATYRNPYREWIGAQIRADYFGYANPGNPERAAEWAWRDASISHTRNGIYGEMWVAAMLAAAYVETDWPTIIEAGLAQIPARCRLASDIREILAARRGGQSWTAVINHIHTRWQETSHHDWCHTNSNAQVVVAALLYGNDQYGETISKAVMAGFDTDCNGATCGSLWGVVHGLTALPEQWTSPMNDIVRTGVTKYPRTSISHLAGKMAETAWKNL
ncbi:MAG: ADP-ribosylglycohydrolase family protein [Opitutales bacterium]|nr:ADP-ribosylglycohydrolase family protein [Opitutales bacterium]